jgi:predicted RNA binding protein YcfA (HicA-like mRNA interferase family)
VFWNAQAKFFADNVLGCATKFMRLTPITRRELIKRLRNLGWDGPFSGGKHQFMVRGAMKLPVPNPHGGVLGVGMVNEILKETEISREEWLSAG